MGKNAKIKKQRRIQRAENQSIYSSDTLKAEWERPELIHRRAKFLLTHDLTKSWLQSQWHFFLGDCSFISAHQQSVLASKLLKSLYQKFKNTYDFDIRTELSLENQGYDFDVAVWFDSHEWTIWTGLRNRPTDEVFLTPEGDEWKLEQIPYPFS